VAGFWKPRRQADTGDAPGNGTDAAKPVATDEDASDPELAEQLARLEEIERRHEQLYTQAETGDAEPGTTAVPLPEAMWPEAIPPLPTDPAGVRVAPLLRWLEMARAVLSARASRNRDELQRLSSQWVHISRNLSRFRGDEVTAVAESQARVRERIAADETACHLIRLLQGHLSEWELASAGVAETAAAAQAPLVAADVELLRRLLEDASADRARAAQALVGGVLEALSGIALDMEVVQRQAEREPDGAAEAVRGLQDRLAGAVEDLRARPGAGLVVPGEDEPLHATLRRCLAAYQPRLAGDLVWSGGEPADPEVGAAVLWIVQEFLAGMAEAGGQEMRLGLAVGEEAAVLDLSAEAPESVVEAGWVLRCQARAAVAGGTLAAVAAADGRLRIQVRFPVAPGAVGVSSAHPWGSAS
jgi:signal transduction histidine kinase